MEKRDERNGKDDNSRRIGISVFRVRGSLPPLFDLLFSFSFFLKKESRWLDGCGSCHVCVFSKFAKFVARGRIGWPSDKRKKETNRRSNPLCSISIRQEHGCAKISLSVAFSLRPIQPIPSLQTLLIGMTRQTWVFKGLFRGIFFFFFLGNGVFHGLPVKLLTRPLFNFTRISIFKTGRGEKVRSKPSIYGLM